MFALVAMVLAAPLTFEALAPGIEYGTTKWIDQPAFGDGLLHVVRLEPKKVEFTTGFASREGVKNRTAADWGEALGLTVTINAGMFDLGDYASHVGYLRSGEYVNQPKWNEYKSAFGFGPGAAMFDLDLPGAKESVTKGFTTVIQNLRLIKAGHNVWPVSGRKWSEAAIAHDDKGRVLFLFSRSPLSMREFNEKLLALPLGVSRAMHAEGGPEASLSIRVGDRKIDLCGSYETGFNENDDNKVQWTLPNVIGVRPR